MISLISGLAASTLAMVAAAAAAPNAPRFDRPPQVYAEGDLPLESGEKIQGFTMPFATYGTLNRTKSNAILVATAIGANHHRLDFLIGPGRALDTNLYFIITTNAIGNGLTTSPSNSTRQPGMSFPRFGIRDMVESQYRLVAVKFGIEHLFAVVGVSMGGMQALQWGTSHPHFMDALVAIVPLGRTPPWTRAVLELARQGIMTDPAWQEGRYSAPPEQGMRLWAGVMALATRTPDLLKSAVPDASRTEPWLHGVQDDMWKTIDARDWVYQSWAYEAHDIGMTPGFGGDYDRALASIKARTLILTGVGDLLNPEDEARAVAERIPGAAFQSIAPNGTAGHATASGKLPAESAGLDRSIASFLTDASAHDTPR